MLIGNLYTKVVVEILKVTSPLLNLKLRDHVAKCLPKKKNSTRVRTLTTNKSASVRYREWEPSRWRLASGVCMCIHPRLYTRFTKESFEYTYGTDKYPRPVDVVARDDILYIRVYVFVCILLPLFWGIRIYKLWRAFKFVQKIGVEPWFSCFTDFLYSLARFF